MTREETWQRLVKLGVVKGDMPETNWNLEKADLSKANLSKANLSKANLREANLSKANLREAYLSEADLFRADLFRADMTEANLTRTNLTRTNLSGVDLTCANLILADLSEANLSEANLSGANLTMANLIWANLIWANLVKTELGSSLLIDTNFNRADLSGATLTGAVFHGVSTSGWKINGVITEYMYFTIDIKNKEKYIRHFPKGKFEELYQSLPTIELIFDKGLSPVELLKLNAVIEELKQENPKLELNLSRMSVERDAARVEIQTPEEENLEEACRVIQEALKKADEKGISVNNLMPQIQQLLPYQDAKNALTPFHNRKLEIHLYSNCNFLVNKGDGTYTQAFGTQATASSITNNIFHQYTENKAAIDAQFDEFKKALRESTDSQKEHLTGLTDRLIEELKAGRDASTAQKIWDEIKEGVKTGGSIASVTSAVMALSKFFG